MNLNDLGVGRAESPTTKRLKKYHFYESLNKFKETKSYTEKIKDGTAKHNHVNLKIAAA